MNLRLAIYELSARYSLKPDKLTRLEELAGLNQEPANLARHIALGTFILAAGLLGFSVILWLAANWQDMSRFNRFALIELLILAAGAGAFFKSQWRAPLGLVTLLSIGGLFAFFGQTYQTGADAWQLFAVWGTLTLPLCLGVKSDAVWTPWTVIVFTGLTLWLKSSLGGLSWDFYMKDISVYLVAWFVMLFICVALSPTFKKLTGAGLWSWRLALTLTINALLWMGISNLFHGYHTHLVYVLTLLIMGGMAAVILVPKYFDIFGVSVATLAINVLITFGLGNALLGGSGFDLGGFIISIFIIGIVAAGLLAFSVSFILKRYKLITSQKVTT